MADAVVSGRQAVKDAWDSLDSGLKQWIVMGVSMAVSFFVAWGRRSNKEEGLMADIELSGAN